VGDTAWIGDLLGDYGYAGLALTLIVNCMGVPIASEVTLPLSGVLVRTGTFNLAVLVTVAVTAQLVGFSLAYALARYGGLDLVERYGRYFWLRRRYLIKLQKLFDRHGARLVLLGSGLPGLHGYMGFPAGLARMPFGQFIASVTLGTVVWTLVFVGLGMLLADNLDMLFATAGVAGAVTTVAVMFVGAGIWYSRHHGRGSHKKEQA
jgi:membrane protein DedA with SNARE-associated domain